MSAKNTTIDEVLLAVDKLGKKTDGQYTEVLEAVKTQGVQTERKFSEINKAVQEFRNQTDSKFSEMHEAFHLLATQIDRRFTQVDDRFQSVESRMTGIESKMITKDYLDDKLANLRGDLTLLTRYEDQKLITLVDLLFGKRLMTKDERKHIMALEPFAHA